MSFLEFLLMFRIMVELFCGVPCVCGTPESVKTKCQIQFAIDRISLNLEEIIHIINMLGFPDPV